MKTTPFNGKLIFSSSINKENSYTSTRLTDNTESEIEIHINEDGTGWFEWIVEELDEYESGGLWFDGNELIDYDGIFELPFQLISYLEKQRYNMNYVKF